MVGQEVSQFIRHTISPANEPGIKLVINQPDNQSSNNSQMITHSKDNLGIAKPATE